MQKTKKEYKHFIKTNFEGLRVKSSMFYNWKNSLRFDLQVGETGSDEYFEEVIIRVKSLFESVFKNSDEIFIVMLDYKYKRRKIRFSNFVFKQISQLSKSEINYYKEKKLYEINDKFDIRNVAIAKLKLERINYLEIFSAIGNTDFPPRKPTLNFLSNKEIFFINIEKKIIFQMYDDRGLDIIASDIETLRPIYKKYNDWILDYDKMEIDKHFENKNDF